MGVVNRAPQATAGDEARSAGLDVAAERAATIGSGHAHQFNSAGAALPSTGVVERVVQHLRQEQRIGGYEAATAVTDQLDAVYDSAAALIGAVPQEIALFDSASTGLRSIVDALRLGAGHRLLVSGSTYVSHALHLLTLSREHGVEVVVVPNAADGAIDLAALDALLAEGPATVCIAHVPTSSGLVEPVVQVGELCRRHGATYMLDATQSVGHLAVDVATIGCHALVTTGRKFLRAPRGTGFAFVSSELLQRLQPTAPDVRGAVWTGARSFTISDTARRFETWESFVAGRLGLGVAIDEAITRGMTATENHLVAAGATLRARLGEISGVRLQDPPASPSAIVTFTVDGLASAEVNRRLADRRVRTVSVPASHAQWDLGSRGVDAVVRASLHVYNDQTDLDAIVAGVADIVATHPSEA